MGQTDDRVRFLARTRQATVFVTDNETVFSLRGAGTTMATVRMALRGAAGGAWRSEERRKTIVASYVGPRANWRDEIPTYEKVRRSEVYPGIGLLYYGKGRDLEYDFELLRGSDASRIRMQFSGGLRTRITSGGDLEIETAAGTLVHQRPRVFQAGIAVEADYRKLAKDEYGIRLGRHNADRPLTIDPVVTFTSFYGGEGDDVITAMSGSAVAGYTNSITFPGNSLPAAGGYDAFFATFGNEERVAYVGGSGDDKAWAVYSSPPTQLNPKPDALNVEYAFAGETNSPDFPVFLRSGSGIVQPAPTSRTFGAAYQTKYGGGKSDGFFFWSTKVFSETTLHSSYIGGSGDDRILGINVNGPILTAVGGTDSTDFPVSATAPQPRLAGGTDGFYFRYNYYEANLRTLSTYYGGSGNDRLTHINQNLMAAGITDSDDLPLVNPLQSQRGGGQDGWIVVMDYFPNRLRPIFSTYLGGSGDDQINAVRFAGRWVAAGTTTSRDFPGGDPAAFRGGSDGFLTEFDYAVTGPAPSITKTTFFGGSDNDEIRDTLIAGEDLVLAGTTGSTDLPLRDPLQPAYGGGDSDAFVAVYRRDGTLPFSSYFGGPGRDEGRGLGLDAFGRWVLAGNSDSPELPGSGHAGARSFAGGTDGFLMRFSSPLLTVSGNLAVKDAVAFAYVSGATLPKSSVRLHIRSADPSRLLLAMTTDLEGQAEIVLDWKGEAFSFQLWALSNAGTVDVVLSAEEIGEQRMAVTLVPVEVNLDVSWGGPRPVDGELRVPFGAAGVPISVRAFMAARAPGSLEATIGLTYPRRGLPPQTLELVSSDPRVLSISQSPIRLVPGSGAIPLQSNDMLRAVGMTQVTARASGSLGTIEATPVRVVHETPRLRIFGDTLGAGLWTNFSVGVGTVSPAPMVTITSLDPEAALLAANLNGAPVPELRMSLTSEGNPAANFVVTGLREGAIARVRASAPGYDDVVYEGPVLRPQFGFPPISGNRLTVGQSALIPVHSTVFDRSGLNLESRPVVRPMSLRLTSSNPDVLQLDSAEFAIAPGAYEALIPMRALAAGTTTLEVTGGPEADPAENRTRLSMTVDPLWDGTLSLDPIVLGKDLQAPVSVYLPPSTAGPITLTSSDPARLLVASAENIQGAAEATGVNYPKFWVQALSGEGRVTLTLSAGNATAATTVDLVPSYAAVQPGGEVRTTMFNPVEFSVSYFPAVPGSYTGLTTPPFALPVIGTRIPGRYAQSLRAGLPAGKLQIENSDPLAGEVTRGGSSESVGGFTFTPKQIGETVLTLAGDGPIGLNPRSARIRVVVAPSWINVNWYLQMMPKDAQGVFLPAYQTQAPGQLMPIPMTATSSDPSKLLLAATAGEPGRESIQFRGQAYVYALSDSGIATVRLSSPASADATFKVGLGPSGATHQLRLRGNLVSEGGSPSGEKPAVMIVGDAPGQLEFGLQDANGTEGGYYAARPASNIRLRLEASPPGVVALSSNEYVLGMSPLVSVTPLAAGPVVIRVTAADGYTIVPNSRAILLEVRLPEAPLTGTYIVMKDHQAMLSTTAANTSVTITSSDPSRVLLATTSESRPSEPAGPGQASITLAAGRNQFFVIALGTGDVTLTTAASGYRPTQSTVRIVPLSLQLQGPERVSLGDTNAYIRVQIRPPQSTGGGAFYPQQNYRPGAPPVSFRLESENPNVAVALSDKLTEPAGQFFIRALSVGIAVFRLIVPEDVVVTPSRISVTVFAP